MGSSFKLYFKVGHLTLYKLTNYEPPSREILYCFAQLSNIRLFHFLVDVVATWSCCLSRVGSVTFNLLLGFNMKPRCYQSFIEFLISIQ